MRVLDGAYGADTEAKSAQAERKPICFNTPYCDIDTMDKAATVAVIGLGKAWHPTKVTESLLTVRLRACRACSAEEPKRRGVQRNWV